MLMCGSLHPTSWADWTCLDCTDDKTHLSIILEGCGSDVGGGVGVPGTLRPHDSIAVLLITHFRGVLQGVSAMLSSNCMFLLQVGHLN